MNIFPPGQYLQVENEFYFRISFISRAFLQAMMVNVILTFVANNIIMIGILVIATVIDDM